LLNKLLARLLTNKRLFCVQFLGRSSLCTFNFADLKIIL
jgi:hypothetical protein